MVAVIQRPQHNQFDHNTDKQHDRDHQDQCHDKAAGQTIKGRREIGSQHVKRTMREVHDVHDAEHQRQTCGDQKQKDTELHPVQKLLDEK